MQSKGIRNVVGREVCTLHRGSRNRDTKEMKEVLVETLWERAPQTKGRTRNVLDMFKDLQGVF